MHDARSMGSNRRDTRKYFSNLLRLSLDEDKRAKNGWLQEERNTVTRRFSLGEKR